MKIYGLQKMTLLDYPGHVACTVFLGGCDYRCPFCHNFELAEGTAPAVMDDGELLAFLSKRTGLLDGVAITGGEPTLSKGLPDLLARIRELGFSTKLDSNGAHPDVLARILQMLLLYLALSSVVIFQPEIRRILAAIGSLIFSEGSGTFDRKKVTPEMMTNAIFDLARVKIGALIAFERGISLRGYEESGVPLDAIPSRELLVSVFSPPLPLHDGGVTIRNGRLAAAHCLFPVSSKPELSGMGMRHRAAIGISEETDALVVAVSEETGGISIAHNGKMIRYASTDPAAKASLLRWIRKAMPVKHAASEQAVAWIKSRIVNLGKGKSK
jgi:uncharacterized protein (TIGR00159 family)